MDNLLSGMNRKPGELITIEKMKKNEEIDEKIFKKLLLLKSTPEYKNRAENSEDPKYKNSLYQDMLIMIDKVDKHMCRPFNLNNFKSTTNKSTH